MVNTLLMEASIGKAKGHKPIAWRGSPNSYIVIAVTKKFVEDKKYKRV